MQVINAHLQEADCHHNIKTIMMQALENIGDEAYQAPVTALETKDRSHGVPRHAIKRNNS